MATATGVRLLTALSSSGIDLSREKESTHDLYGRTLWPVVLAAPVGGHTCIHPGELGDHVEAEEDSGDGGGPPYRNFQIMRIGTHWLTRPGSFLGDLKGGVCCRKRWYWLWVIWPISEDQRWPRPLGTLPH